MTLSNITLSRGAGRRGWLRLGGLLAAFAFTVALGLGASRAAAQPSPHQPRPQLVGDFLALTLTYTDAQGPGTVTITFQGPDAASGGTTIAVLLVQNGVAYTGGGFVRPGELGGYVLDFTITGPYGERYHLSGTLMHELNGVGWRGQGRWWATWNRAITDAWQLAEGSHAEPPPHQTLSTTVRLAPTTNAPMGGRVILTALPAGETRFDLSLSGLLPGKAYAIQLHAGTPGLPSASFTQLATVHADAFGQAAASGLVRVRGTAAIPLLDIADGNHVITVVGFGQTVAVGSIPALGPLG